MSVDSSHRCPAGRCAAGLFVACALVLGLSAVVQAAPAQTAAKPAAPKPADAKGPAKPAETKAAVTNAPAKEIPRSVFVVDLKTSRDPFFPKSDRFGERKAPPTTGTPQPVTTTTATAKPTGGSALVLKGVSVVGQRRVALIDGYAFAVGEEMNVRTTNGLVRVRCMNIADRSVTVRVEGESGNRELQLPKKL